MLVLIAVAGAWFGSPGCGARAAGSPVTMTLPALDGGTLVLSQYRGRPVVLHFFTTWSVAAGADIEQLRALHRARGDEIAVIGVAMDVDGYDLVAPWRRATAVEYLVGLASDALVAGRTSVGRIVQVPSTIILDRQGRVAHRIDRPLEPGELPRLVSKLTGAR